MATISTTRASYNRPKPTLNNGNRPVHATQRQLDAIKALKQALSNLETATTEAAFTLRLRQVRDAYSDLKSTI